MAKTELPLVHQEVKAALRARLETDWPAGQRLPPIKQLARELGAGQNNTHRAVKELVAEGLLMSRPRRGTFVSQRGGARAAAAKTPLAGKRINIVRGNREPFLDPVVHAVVSRLESAGAAVHVDLVAQPDDLVRAQGDAIMMVNASGIPMLRWPSNQPAVIVDTALERPVAMPDGYDIVSVDSEQGGHLAGQWMRTIGVRDVCYLAVVRDGQLDQTSRQRLRGFESGFHKPVRCRIDVEAYMLQCGAKAFAEYLALPDRPSGVFCASDDLAVGFVHGGLAHGMEPGRDYQLIGFDGQMRGRELPWPLTTVDAPMASMGEVAAEMMVQRVQDPRQPVRRVHLGCTLFEGATALKRK